MAEQQKLTIKQVMARTGARRSTVNRWCRTKKLPNAEKIQSPTGEYWLIPESDLALIGEVKLGRPKKHE